MYTILVNDDNTLFTSVRERIMQRSKLMNSLHFLIRPEYEISDFSGYDKPSNSDNELNVDNGSNSENIPPVDTEESEEKNVLDEGEIDTTPIVVDGIADMSKFTVMIEYILPVSKQYKSEILTLTMEKSEGETLTPKLYKNRLEYKLPFDTGLTSEPGDIELQLTFTAIDLDADGNGYQYVRKTSTTTITIVPISNWSDIIPDKALNALDQRLLETQKQIKALEELNDISAISKADNIKLDEKTKSISLTSNGEQIGDAISISDLGDSIVQNTESGTIKMLVI